MQVRKDGYAYSIEEFSQGVITIAAPIYDYTGKVISALSIVGPIQRIQPRKFHPLPKGLKVPVAKYRRTWDTENNRLAKRHLSLNLSAFLTLSLLSNSKRYFCIARHTVFPPWWTPDNINLNIR